MSTEDLNEIKQTIIDTIVVFCETNGIDYHDPSELEFHKAALWEELKATGKIHPLATIDVLNVIIAEERMRARVRKQVFDQ